MSNEQAQRSEYEITWDDELQQWLADYVSTHPQHPTAILARAEYIAISRRALDSYIAGTYFLPKRLGGHGIQPVGSNIENAIRRFRERVESAAHLGYEKSFVKTDAWERLKQACTVAINENVIVVLYGRPGVGKTRCLAEFAEREMNTAPVSILCSRNITPLYFVQRLAQELNITEVARTAPLEDAIATKLSRYPRPLFVDQANYLSEKSLGSVCYIWEKAHIPIVLGGTKELYVLFTTSTLTEGVRAQLSSRVALHYMLPELKITEVKAIIERALGEDATDEVIAQIYNVTGGVFRHVDMIIPRILQLKERAGERLRKNEVTMKDIITVAGSRLILG